MIPYDLKDGDSTDAAFKPAYTVCKEINNLTV